MIGSMGILLLDDEPPPPASPSPADEDPGVVVLTCANCGAAMDERKCKLICRCGYFLSCSDYY
jgi:exosome complex RNA-binding protein Csl4